MVILFYALIGLLSLSIILFLLSLFLKDPYKSIQEEIDQMSILHIQEIYTIKKKLKILEEELLTTDTPLPSPITHPSPAIKGEVHEIIKSQVSLLAKQGLSLDQIAVQSSLTIEEVKTILTEKKFRGEA
ncbi:hypothetical protein [Cytobacillus horneckiae]|uniref:hypothetical protein n=1 Tax=Cytobacillus horneckiae TaxID=549687 RepID=UPI003D9A51C4